MKSDEQGLPEASGSKEVRKVYLHPDVRREMDRILVTRDIYRRLSHAIWDYLDRSLLHRIERGAYLCRKLAAEVVGRTAERKPREKALLNLPDWGRVEEAARRVNRDLRQEEEQVVWEGSLRSVPFCRVGPRAIVRAAALEIAELSRGASSKRYSRKETGGEAARVMPDPGPDCTITDKAPFDADPFDANPGDGVLDNSEPGVEGHNENRPAGEGPAGKDPGDQGFQKLTKLPGRERGGKLVKLCITAEANEKLCRKAARLNQTTTDLVRHGILKLLHWIEGTPTEASDYIRAESNLYWPLGERAEDQENSGFQIRVAPKTKRRLEEARERLEQIRERPGRRSEKGPGRYASQREILQAAARLALESGEMKPPLPGQGKRK
jgi:hypothetical protein